MTISCEKQVYAIGMKQSNAIYRMFFRVKQSRAANEANLSTTDLKVWHERLGHVSGRALCDMVRNGLVNGVKIKKAEKFFCEPCQYRKAHRLPFKERPGKRSTKPGECVHTDVCGRMHVDSLSGASYYATFIDDASEFCYVYFLKHKDEVFEKFKTYKSMVANKFEQRIKTVQSDNHNGRKYINSKIKEYLDEREIIMKNTASHTPKQNGKAERANRNIMECARTMLRAKNLPKNSCGLKQ